MLKKIRVKKFRGIIFNPGTVVLDARMDWAISGSNAVLEDLETTEEPRTTWSSTTTTERYTTRTPYYPTTEPRTTSLELSKWAMTNCIFSNRNKYIFSPKFFEKLYPNINLEMFAEFEYENATIRV